MTELLELTEAWRAVARYSVYRTEGCKQQGQVAKIILHTNLTYEQAVENEYLAKAALQVELGYRPYVMSRPLIGIDLERPCETRAEFVALRGQSTPGSVERLRHEK